MDNEKYYKRLTIEANLINNQINCIEDGINSLKQPNSKLISLMNALTFDNENSVRFTIGSLGLNNDSVKDKYISFYYEILKELKKSKIENAEHRKIIKEQLV